jgi:hypothetical protein
MRFARSFPLSTHPHNVVVYFIIAAIIAHKQMVRLGSNPINQRGIIVCRA